MVADYLNFLPTTVNIYPVFGKIQQALLTWERGCDFIQMESKVGEENSWVSVFDRDRHRGRTLNMEIDTVRKQNSRELGTTGMLLSRPRICGRRREPSQTLRNL